MTELENAFQRFKGRMPNADDKLILHTLKDHYKISDDDQMWGIFFALDYHLELYKEIPEKLKIVCGYLEKREAEIFDVACNKARKLAKIECEKVKKEHELQMQGMLNKAIKKAHKPQFFNVTLLILTATTMFFGGVVAALMFIKSNPAILNM